MKSAITSKKNLLNNPLGQGLTEYMTLVILVALVAVAAVKGVGREVKNKLMTARKHIREDINFKDIRYED